MSASKGIWLARQAYAPATLRHGTLCARLGFASDVSAYWASCISFSIAVSLPSSAATNAGEAADNADAVVLRTELKRPEEDLMLVGAAVMFIDPRSR